MKVEKCSWSDGVAQMLHEFSNDVDFQSEGLGFHQSLSKEELLKIEKAANDLQTAANILSDTCKRICDTRFK